MNNKIIKRKRPIIIFAKKQKVTQEEIETDGLLEVDTTVITHFGCEADTEVAL